jgi:DNA polymerase-3 subunit delta
MQEAADTIRRHFRDAGFTEREVFSVEKTFDWGSFQHSANNLSLFSERKIFDLRFSSAKFDDSAKQALQHYIDSLSPDNILLVSSPKLEAATLNTQWFKKIEAKSGLVQIWPINRDGLASWLEQRLLRENIRADGAALQLLMDKVEGNLLAAMQEIEKLKLLSNANETETIGLDANTVMQVVADSSRFNVYNLVDATLTGDLPRAEKILVGLRSEGTFPLLILNAFVREIRSLQPMLEKKQLGQGVNAIMQTARVWYNRKQAVGSALQRLDSADTWRLLDHARTIDQSIKGMASNNVWDELSVLILSLSGHTR